MKEDQKIVIYQTEDGQTQIDVRLENEMIWLTRQQLQHCLAGTIKPSVSTSTMRSRRNWLMKW